MGFWMVFFVSLAMSAVSYLLMPKPQPQNAEAGQLDGPTAEEGKPIPVVYGTVVVKSANIIDWWGASTVPIKSKGGKK